MEVTVTWFWLIKLLFTFVALYIAYKAMIKYKFKNKYWNIIFIIWLILSIYMPIKIGTNMTQYSQQQTVSIEQSKVLPEKVIDTSFKDSVEALKPISKEDIK